MTNTDESRAMARQDRFAAELTARLSDGAAELPYDISERLRAARMQAVAKRKVAVSVRTASSAVAQGGAAALTFGDEEETGWLNRLASFLPLFALVAGLLVIQFVQDDNRIRDLAEVDSALLTDDLPTAAYTDPGFLQYLKSSFDANQKTQ
ncbi:hypothetical protein RD110_14220 [Rhodoferax koreense]|uniref:DUF3619 domain-containing protein n=1 Tax=Rhodoferax koreensis TaxID=1842727 RepID=A0A1P8JWS6_9BURK|nr:DUF3619 family protein [Rhodoferax koreense]APW38213.1 hypothetical protein RD110_14220 [Rhodoferax koreense]